MNTKNHEKRILVLFDNLTRSESALAHARLFAKHWNARLALVHSWPEPEPPAVHRKANEKRWRSSFDTYLESGRRRAEQVVDEIRDAGIQAELHSTQLYPDAAMLHESEEHPCDLLVVGWPDDNTVQHRAAIKVAERVARQARKPVLIARGEPTSGHYGRILVPTDFSTTANRALTLALDVASETTEIEVAHFWQSFGTLWPYFDAPGDLMQSDSEQLVHHAASLGKALIEKYERADVTMTFHHECARPVDGIFERAREEKVDLVVMGSHGRRGVRRWVIGSVSEDTMRDAPCSVLIVPPQETY